MVLSCKTKLAKNTDPCDSEVVLKSWSYVIALRRLWWGTASVKGNTPSDIRVTPSWWNLSLKSSSVASHLSVWCVHWSRWLEVRAMLTLVSVTRVPPRSWSFLWCSSSQRPLFRPSRYQMAPHPTVGLRWKSWRWAFATIGWMLGVWESGLKPWFFSCTTCNSWVLFSLTSQAVTALVKNFPKHMVSSMQQILPIVWNTLTESAALYPFQKA